MFMHEIAPRLITEAGILNKDEKIVISLQTRFLDRRQSCYSQSNIYA